MAINTASGLYRMAQVIQWGSRIFCWLWGIGGLWVVLLVILRDRVEIGVAALFGLTFFGGIGLLVWGISHALAWILEGFANDS